MLVSLQKPRAIVSWFILRSVDIKSFWWTRYYATSTTASLNGLSQIGVLVLYLLSAWMFRLESGGVAGQSPFLP